ncbi:MAG: hypothetical protein U9N57_00700, partial [Pseudomonadota bacterium]|nr:hypothetical protein [Pseudomonadota bacterium]
MPNNKKLIDAVVVAFGKQTGLSIHSEIPAYEDGPVLLWVEGLNKPFEAYAKTTLTRQNLSSVIYEMSQKKVALPKVLIAPYINPNLIEKLRGANIFCLDAAGNAFIQK